MDDKVNFIEPLFERAEECLKTSLELFKLKMLNKTIMVLSAFVSSAAVFLVLLMFIFFLNIGAALWLGEMLGRLYYGFFCIACFYGIIWSVLYFFMGAWIKKRVSNSIISQILN